MLNVFGPASLTGVIARPPVEKDCRPGSEKSSSPLRMKVLTVLAKQKRKENASRNLVLVRGKRKEIPF